jgi:hypothetical protein
MTDLTFGWGKFLGEIAQIINTQQLRKHSDEYTRLEYALKKELETSYEERDDVRIMSLRKELAIVRDAFQRDLKVRE